MSELPRAAVLLSTYNGARYLPEQIDSLLAQSHDDLIIVARDDGSSDESFQVLRAYAARHPEKFHLVQNDTERRGASGSFAFLIDYVLAHKQALALAPAYMLFCDQDDIWQPHKVAAQFAAMLAAETEAAQPQLPVLVHSDLEVVSEQNQSIARSLIRYQGLEIERNRFPNIVISNLVTGCTALINEALARKALPIPANAIMHDWWLALVASAFGRLVYLEQPLVRYRQHDSNTIGAKEFIRPGPGSRGFWARVFGRKPNAHLYEVARQAAEFRRRFGAELGVRNRLGLRLSACMRAEIGVVQRLFYRLARRV